VNVIVNTIPKGDFFVEMDEGKNLFITVVDAKTLMLQYAEDKIIVIRGDEQYVPLSALRDVTYTFDEKKLTVAIIGKTTESGKTAADLFSLQSSAKNIYYPRETSAFINYGLNYIYNNTDGFQSFAVTNKVGFRTGDVFFTSDSLYTKTETSDSFVRLQSSATYERRGDLQWLVFGDQYANSGDLGSTVNIGGIGFSKVYRLDPYFITQPVMNLRGSVIFPTQAEIYLDGVLIGKQTISPGSFDLKNLYSYTGTHNVEVLLKDPFGNVQKISYLAYFSSQMLREGLHEYSYNAGFLRDNYGTNSNDYGKTAFSAFHRYGVTNSLNVGARAEGSEGIYNGGIYTTVAVPRAGQVTLSVAGSSAVGNDVGGAFSLQHSYQLGSFSTNLLLRGYTRDYATVGSFLPTAESTQYEMNIGAGLTINPLGSFSVNYSENETFKGVDTRVISVNYSRALYKAISLFATASLTQAIDTMYSGFVGLNFDLGKGVRGSAQVSGGSGDVNMETLQLQKDIPVGEGVGYRASVNRSETANSTLTSFNPFVQYNAKYGIYSVDATIQNTAGKSTELYNLSAAGSLVYAGGFVGLSRPVSDSFGMVVFNKEVPGAAVLLNGQDMGKTGSSGTLVVPTLSSYSQNKITLDTKNIPIDYSISDVNRLLSPSLWSGACIAFDVQQSRAITGTLVLRQEGKKTPLEFVEVSMKVGLKSFTFPTGKGGEFYVENSIPADEKAAATDSMSCSAIAERRKTGGNIILPGIYRAAVEYDGGKCEFSITFPKTEEAITELGEILCGDVQTSTPPVQKLSLLKEKFFYAESAEDEDVSEPLSSAVINQLVKLKDVRHRLLNNNILGQISVVEGTAVNQSHYPISRILIKGEIVGANSAVLVEQAGYAGNILTDEELANLSEAEILKKLFRPEGLNNSNDKIMPEGKISFMIVFFREPAGFIETTVMPISLERIVPAPTQPVKEAPPIQAPTPSVKEIPPAPTPLPSPQDVAPAAVEKKPEKVSIILNVYFDDSSHDIKKNIINSSRDWPTS
jgi:outer membrane usher protein FimD/PapC